MIGGRGGIRTHGGFPHARFRVECLKPDSATLPLREKERRTVNVQHRTSNASITLTIRSARRPWLAAATRTAGPRVASFLASRAGLGRPDCSPHEAKKCYNFRLAMCAELTASCMSTRTATLLLVVDRYSQVLGAAVHQYSQPIGKPQPLPYRHDSTQTRNSARVTE